MMKKYYYKNDNGDVFTNDTCVVAPSTKPITACYSGRFFRSDNDDINTYEYGNHTPWFCMKDGKYPIYEITTGGTFNDASFRGFRRIFDFTVSSLSGQYYFTPSSNPANSYNKYTNYRVPYTTPYLQKLDWIVDNENLFDPVNLNSAVKLQWKMKKELITQFHTYYGGPHNYAYNSGFIMKSSLRGSTTDTSIVGFGAKNDSNNILNYSNMDFTKVTPTVIWHDTTNGINNELILHGTPEVTASFNGYTPPHFTLEKNNFPSEATGIKVKIDGLFLHSKFVGNSYYNINDIYVNNTATFNNGEKSPNCLGFIYQTNTDNVWHWHNDTQPNIQYDYLNGNYSATFDYIPDGAGNKLKNKSTVKTTDKTFCVNYWQKMEHQYLSDPDFWNNIFVYYSNRYNSQLYYLEDKNDATNTGYMYIPVGQEGDYRGKFNVTEVNDKYNITYSEFLTANNRMENLNGEIVDFSANDRFVIYAHSGALNIDAENKKYYNCNTYCYYNSISSTANSLSLSALGSINNNLSSYIIEARDGWKWNPTGNAPSRSDFRANNYDISNETLEYVIPIDDVTGDFLHISYPITTVMCGTDSASGLVLEYQMSYEFVK